MLMCMEISYLLVAACDVVATEHGRWLASSPGPSPPQERPGTHCLRVRVIFPVFKGFVN